MQFLIKLKFTTGATNEEIRKRYFSNPADIPTRLLLPYVDCGIGICDVEVKEC